MGPYKPYKGKPFKEPKGLPSTIADRRYHYSRHWSHVEPPMEYGGELIRRSLRVLVQSKAPLRDPSIQIIPILGPILPTLGYLLHEAFGYGVSRPGAGKAHEQPVAEVTWNGMNLCLNGLGSDDPSWGSSFSQVYKYSASLEAGQSDS